MTIYNIINKESNQKGTALDLFATIDGRQIGEAQAIANYTGEDITTVLSNLAEREKQMQGDGKVSL